MATVMDSEFLTEFRHFYGLVTITIHCDLDSCEKSCAVRLFGQLSDLFGAKVICIRDGYTAIATIGNW
jgi:hypothetical protein